MLVYGTVCTNICRDHYFLMQLEKLGGKKPPNVFLEPKGSDQASVLWEIVMNLSVRNICCKFFCTEIVWTLKAISATVLSGEMGREQYEPGGKLSSLRRYCFSNNKCCMCVETLDQKVLLHCSVFWNIFFCFLPIWWG